MSIIDNAASVASLCRTILQSPDARLPRETIVLICQTFIALAEKHNATAAQVASQQTGLIGARMGAYNSAATDLSRGRR